MSDIIHEKSEEYKSSVSGVSRVDLVHVNESEESEENKKEFDQLLLDLLDTP